MYTGNYKADMGFVVPVFTEDNNLYTNILGQKYHLKPKSETEFVIFENAIQMNFKRKPGKVSDEIIVKIPSFPNDEILTRIKN